MSVAFIPPPRRILVRGVNWLGDAVMTTPALLRLREKFPGAHIALLTPAKLRELWLNQPTVDEVIPFAPGEGIWSIGGKLRAGKYDLALVLPNSPRSALEVFLAGIPQRIGYQRPWRNLLLTQAIAPRIGVVKMQKRSPAAIHDLIRKPKPQITPPASSHQIHEYLHLAARVGASPEPLEPQISVAPGEVEAAKRKFGLENITQPVFGLNPGAEYGPAKRWPIENFIAAARGIQQRTNCIWLLFGGSGDVELAERIAAEIHPPSSLPHPQNLAGRTSLRELMSLLKVCRVLLTNDTGPMHVAAALGTPVVVPFGSTSPELTGPGLQGDSRHRLLKSDAPCSPCFLRECPIDFRCMNSISVARVVEAVSQTAQSNGTLGTLDTPT